MTRAEIYAQKFTLSFYSILYSKKIRKNHFSFQDLLMIIVTIYVMFLVFCKVHNYTQRNQLSVFFDVAALDGKWSEIVRGNFRKIAKFASTDLIFSRLISCMHENVSKLLQLGAFTCQN